MHPFPVELFRKPLSEAPGQKLTEKGKGIEYEKNRYNFKRYNRGRLYPCRRKKDRKEGKLSVCVNAINDLTAVHFFVLLEEEG